MTTEVAKRTQMDIIVPAEKESLSVHYKGHRYGSIDLILIDGEAKVITYMAGFSPSIKVLGITHFVFGDARMKKITLSCPEGFELEQEFAIAVSKSQ